MRLTLALPLPVLLAGCLAVNPPPPEQQGPIPPYDANAAPLEEDGYRATVRSDGSIVVDMRYTAPDMDPERVPLVLDCAAADFAIKRGYVSFTRIGQGKSQIEVGVGFPQPVMQGSNVYRMSLADDGAVDAAERLAACQRDGLAEGVI